VWLVELAAVTGQDAVAPAICQVLGIATQPGQPTLEALLDTLAPQDVLIVLDNCEHLVSGCAKTADAIGRRCPRVHLLATSRGPLGIGGEAIYRVPPLSLPGPGDGDAAAAESADAVVLFLERARAQGVGLVVDAATAPLVVSICARLDGLPLAIELAAARLRSLSLADLAGRLDQRFRLLTGGSRTAPGRQQTLQATVEWSYSLLNGADPELFGRALLTAAGTACWVDIAMARRLGEQAVRLARQLGADRLLIGSLAALSATYFLAGEPAGRPDPARAVAGRHDPGGADCASVSAPSSAETPAASAAPIRWKISSARRSLSAVSSAWPAARAQRPSPASACASSQELAMARARSRACR
jgi:hypothetical protein